MKDLHGQEANYVVDLSELGLGPSGERWQTQVPEVETPAGSPTQAGVPGEMMDLYQEAIDYRRRLVEVGDDVLPCLRSLQGLSLGIVSNGDSGQRRGT